MAIPPVVVRIIGEEDDAERALKDIERSAERIGRSLERVGNRLTLGVTLPLTIAGGAALKFASDAEETGAKFEAVFRSLSGDVRGFAGDLARELGRSDTELEGFLATLQDTFVPLGFARDQAAEMSKQLVQLGIDLAAFNNASEPETIDRLTSAIVGNHEAVRGFGIVITEAALKQELLRSGLVRGKEAATEQEKALARMNIILRSTTDAQGSALREADGFANTMRRLQAVTREIGEEFGEQLVPAANELSGQMIGLLESVRDLDPEMKRFLASLGVVAAGAGPALRTVAELTTALGLLSLSLRVGLLPLIGIGGPIAIGLGVLAAGMVRLKLDAAAAKAELEKLADDTAQAFEGMSAAVIQSQIASREAVRANLIKELADLQAERDRQFSAQARPSFEGSLLSGGVPRLDPETSRLLQETEDSLTRLGAEITGLQQALASVGKQGAKPVANAMGVVNAETEKAVEAARKLVERWREMQETSIERQLRELKEFAAAARLIGDSKSFAQIDAQLTALEGRIKRGLTPAVAEVAEISTNLSTVGGVSTALRSVDLAMADFGTRLAEIREQAARGILSAPGVEEAERAAAAALNKDLLGVIDALRAAGKLTPELHRQLTDALQIADPAAESFDEIARKIEQAGRGGIQLARTIGIVSDEAADALSSLVQIGAALPGAAAGDFSSIVSLVGGLASLIGGGGDSESRRVAEQNTAALDRLTRGIARLGDQLLGLPGERFGQVAGAIGAAESAQSGNQFQRLARFFDSLAEQLTRLGLTMDDLRDIARGFGIELDGTIESFEALRRAIAEFDFDQLFETAAGKRRLGDVEAELFDFDEVAKLDQLQSQFGTQIGRALQELFGQGFDISTKEGRAALDAFIRDIFAQFKAGTLDLSALGDLSVDEFLEFLTAMESSIDSIDELGESARAAAGALLNVPEGFKVNLARFRATEGVDVGAVLSGATRPGLTIQGNVIVEAADPETFLAKMEKGEYRRTSRGGTTALQLSALRS